MPYFKYYTPKGGYNLTLYILGTIVSPNKILLRCVYGLGTQGFRDFSLKASGQGLPLF